METTDIKKPNMWDVKPLNEDGTKVEILSYFCNNGDIGSPELLHSEIGECSAPIFLCDIDDETESEIRCLSELGEPEITKKIKFENKLHAIFYTNKHHFNQNVSAYDYEHIIPEKPMQENNYKKFCDGLYETLKHFNGAYEKDFPEDARQGYMEKVKKFDTEESKKKWLTGFVTTMLKFEAMRPAIKKIVDDYMAQNPQYICARIYRDYKEI